MSNKPRRKTTKAKTQPRTKGENFVARTEKQKEYIRAILENDVIYCTGSAGSGKSVVALAMAAQFLIRGEYDKVVVARPCIEASPRGLGFLPGGINDKLDPYIRNIKKELKRFMGEHSFLQAIAEGHIDISPLEYMRGETFEKTVMILDEAENCTFDQLKMFVTRMGVESKVIINGDIEQCDARRFMTNQGKTDLESVIDKTHHLDGFSHIQFSDEDIVRNSIIKGFLRALRNE